MRISIVLLLVSKATSSQMLIHQGPAFPHGRLPRFVTDVYSQLQTPKTTMTRLISLLGILIALLGVAAAVQAVQFPMAGFKHGKGGDVGGNSPSLVLL
jgi:hypothetical protein